MTTRSLPLRYGVPGALLLLALALTAFAFVNDWLRADGTVEELTRRRAIALGSVASPTLERLLGRGDVHLAAAEVARMVVVPNLNRALVLDETNRVQGATDFTLPGQALRETTAAVAEPLVARARETKSAQTEITRDRATLRAAFPFPLSPLPGELRASRLAVFYTETNLGALLRVEREGIVRRTLVMGMVTLLFCFAAGVYFHTGFARRLDHLVAGVTAYSSRSPRPPVSAEGQDELARIGQAVNEMAANLTAQTAALRESEQRSRGVLETALDAIITVDAKGVVLEFNPAAEKIFGYRRDAALGRQMAELIVPPALRDAHFKGFQRYLSTGEARLLGKRMEVPALRSDGTQFEVELAITRIAQAGAPLFTAYLRDITEHKRAQARVEHLNRVYSVLIDINQNIVREKNSRAMLENACRITVVKGEFRMAWIGIRDAPGRPMSITAHAGADEDTLNILRAMLGDEPQDGACAFTSHALQTGQHGVCNDIACDPRTASWREPLLQRGYRSMASLPVKAGDTVIGTFNLYAGEPDFFDEDELRLLDQLATDISFALEVARQEAERRKAEDELRWRTAFFEAQVNSALDGILVVDHQGKTILQNERFNQLWKIPRHIAEDGDDAAQAQFATSRTKNPAQFIERVRHLYAHLDEVSRDEVELLDGTILDRYSSPVRDQAGKHFGRIWAFRDITEQRKLEEQFRQSQKMEAIGQLAGGVAHDFNNILAVIMMQAEVTGLVENLPAEVRDDLRQIRASAERAANLTRQLLLFSRKQVMQPCQLDLNEVVSSLAKMLQRIIGVDVRLQLNLCPRPLLTRADAGMLDQVLMNLVVNARDAMPGGGQLFIETSEKVFTAAEAATIPEAAPGSHVCLRVTDTGSGIPPEILARVFEPFFTTKEPGKGTGLGLATVFGIVKQHDGALTVESEVGQGTTFRIFLRAQEVTAQSRAQESIKPQPRGGTETILLVEDEASVRRLTRVVLERAGYRVLEAAQGVEALQIWEREAPTIHLLLTDIVMPEGLSGLELAARLQTNKPGLRVIFTSGYSEEIAGRELALQEGQNFLQKPASPQHILETVRRCLDG